MKKLFNLLESRNYSKIGYMVEALVGLLRNNEESTTYDVRLYLQKYKGLKYKMQNVVI